ncbi:MAG: cupin domain-containing protein [Candidatus Thermoplasmatota archaeon]
MKDKSILMRKGEALSKAARPGRLYRLMIKSEQMEAIIAELDPHTESRWFKHEGEEMHLLLQGEMEYTVGDHSYKLNEGDILWHRSDLRHRAKNIGDEKVVYITVSSPPTFMWEEV